MEHTKHKLVAVGDEFLLYLREDKANGKLLCTMQFEGNFADQEGQNANANRLVLCWNEHDSLVVACKALLSTAKTLKGACDKYTDIVGAPNPDWADLKLVLTGAEQTIARVEAG